MEFSLPNLLRLSRDQFYVTLNGKLVDDWSTLKESDHFLVNLRVLGGKGGFGSLLRSFGSQFYKSTNQDMCRDLSGRRLKDVKEEERLKKYISKAAQREDEKQKKQQEKYKKLKQLDERKHEFNDAEYTRSRERILEETEDAVQQGLKALEEDEAKANVDPDGPGTSGTSSLGKRKRQSDDDSSSSAGSLPEKATTVEPKAKKPKGGLWLGIDGLNESDLDSDSDAEEGAKEETVTLMVKEAVEIQVKADKVIQG